MTRGMPGGTGFVPSVSGGTRFVASAIGKIALIVFALCVATAPSPSWVASTTPPAILVDLTTHDAGGVCIWSSEFNSGYRGFKAFDNGRYNNANGAVDGSRWLAKYSTAGMYVTYKFKKPTAVDGLGIFIPQSGGNNYSNRAPNTWTFSGSNDDSTWTVLDTQTGETDWVIGEFRRYMFANSTPYKYYKFNCTALNGATDCLQILELEFYNSTGVPVEATWSGRGETASLSDADNWYPALYAISGGMLEASSLSYLGAYGGTGSLDIDGDGVVRIQDSLEFGYGSSESPTHGRVSIAGNGSLSATSMELGCLNNISSSGEIIQTGGECRTDNDIFVGYGNGSSGTMK